MDGWYRLSGAKATFAVKVVNDRIVFSAPYGQRWLLGKLAAEVFYDLELRDWTIDKLG